MSPSPPPAEVNQADPPESAGQAASAKRRVGRPRRTPRAAPTGPDTAPPLPDPALTRLRPDPGAAPERRTPPPSPAAAAAWPSQFAQVLTETLAGSRPSRQLTPWTTERARAHIRRLGPLLASTEQPRIRRIVARTPSSGVVEMAVVARFGTRVRALAIRLERAPTPESTWRCTAVEAA